MKAKSLNIIFVSVTLLIAGCIKPFIPTGMDSMESLIVIEGDIIQNDTTRITVSRSLGVNEEGGVDYISTSTVWVESEKEFDIASALAGCSPAWMALVAEALSDGAVKLGLKRELSYHYIATLFEGMGAVLKSEHPAILKDKVMSPGGTTAAGYAKLEEGQVRDSFIKAMEASYEKAKSLS